MKIFFIMTFVLFGIIQINEQCGKNEKQSTNKKMSQPVQTPIDQLPEGIAPDTEVEGRAIKNDKGGINSYEVTIVEKRLIELKAKYEEGKLVDGKKKEIQFFKRLCRGVSQGFEEDEQERLRSENELAELQKKYTVVILYCDLRKLM